MIEIRNSWVEESEETELLVQVTGGYCIMLYNDDVNTFDHVIECLIKYCKHTPEQAEQCAILVHFKGKCVIKHGDNVELKPICEALCMQELSAVLEEMD